VSDPFAPARAAKSAARNARIEQYRRLTRIECLTAKAACKELKISHATGANYEEELVRITGMTWKTARRLRCVQLRNQGLPTKEIAERMGVHVETVRLYAATSEEAAHLAAEAARRTRRTTRYKAQRELSIAEGTWGRSPYASTCRPW
jgi:DNA-binding NarL/FixJ family response regulator